MVHLIKIGLGRESTLGMTSSSLVHSKSVPHFVFVVSLSILYLQSLRARD